MFACRSESDSRKKEGNGIYQLCSALENNALLATQDMLYLGSYGGGLFGIDLYNRQVSNAPKYFSTLFRKKFGFSPNQFSKDGQSIERVGDSYVIRRFLLVL